MADDQCHAGLLAVVTMETVAGATICCTGLRNYHFKGRQLEVCRATTKKYEDSAQPNVTQEAESSSGVTSSSEAKLPDTGELCTLILLLIVMSMSHLSVQVYVSRLVVQLRVWFEL